MKFSILVPVYNVEKYLEQCVESLLSQTYTGDYEIILVNDGSTDNSAKICDGYLSKHPEKVRVIHKENQGLLSARDVGIAEAQGEYCIFVDSDDFVDENLLQVVFEEIKKNDSPDMVIYSFRYYENGTFSKAKTAMPDKLFSANEKSFFYNYLIDGNIFTAIWTKAVKASILKNDPTDYTVFYGKNLGEDWLRSIYIFTVAERIACKNIALYNYRNNLQSISRNHSIEKIETQNILHVYNTFLKYISAWDMDAEECKERLKNRWLNETVYTFSKFYENAENNAERKQIIDYDWSSFLPTDFSLDELKNTKTAQCELYKMIMGKQYSAIRLHFLKNLIYKNYKKITSKVKK